MITAALNPGRMDRRVTLRYRSTTRDAIGAVVDDSEITLGMWAQWLPASGREFVSSGARHADATGVLRVRWRQDLAPTMLLTIDGESWEMVAPAVMVGRREYLDLAVRQQPVPVVAASSIDLSTTEAGANALHDLVSLTLPAFGY